MPHFHQQVYFEDTRRSHDFASLLVMIILRNASTCSILAVETRARESIGRWLQVGQKRFIELEGQY